MRLKRVKEPLDEDLLKIYGILILQFDKNFSTEVLREAKYIAISSTGRLRGVLDGDLKPIIHIRPDSYRAILTDKGAILLSRVTHPPKYRVIIRSNEVENIHGSKSLLAPVVIDADTAIRSGDEVLVVDENDKLLGYGKARLSGYEIASIKRGEVVRMRGWINHAS